MEWRKVTCRDNYSVSDFGDIRNDKTGRILKLHHGTSGYYQVMLGRKTSPLYVHRLVAMAFIPNPDSLPVVDHINGVKTDNRVGNLRWVTVSENSFGYGHEQNIENKKKRIAAMKDGVAIIFKSRRDAAEHFGFDTTHMVYGRPVTRGKCDGWVFSIVKDMV